MALLISLVGTATSANTSPSIAEAGSAKPRAVIIVGPSHGSTAEYLSEGQLFANQAMAAGMEVTTVFHPHATWERVVTETEGVNLLVYFGHGNGWPSPYAPFQELTKNGFGLDVTAGGSSSAVKYWGGRPIRKSLRLARDAVVVLYRACYAAGNGEMSQAYPSPIVAIQRVDNFAAAFLRPKVGASAVFAFATKQWIDLAAQLMRPNRTMEQILRTRSQKPGWYTSGWVGHDPLYADSQRTPGARLLLDRHVDRGFARALSGNLGMTTDEWRDEAEDLASPPALPAPSSTPEPVPSPTSTPGSTPKPVPSPTPTPSSIPTRAPSHTPSPTPTAAPSASIEARPSSRLTPVRAIGSPPPKAPHTP